jgi:hypothetical protein
MGAQSARVEGGLQSVAWNFSGSNPKIESRPVWRQRHSQNAFWRVGAVI